MVSLALPLQEGVGVFGAMRLGFLSEHFRKSRAPRLRGGGDGPGRSPALFRGPSLIISLV